MAMTQQEVAEEIRQVSVLYGEITDLQNINFEMRETPDGNFIMMTGNKMFKNFESGVKVPSTLTKAELEAFVADANTKMDAAVKTLVKARKDAIKAILAALTVEMNNGAQ